MCLQDIQVLGERGGREEGERRERRGGRAEERAVERQGERKTERGERERHELSDQFHLLYVTHHNVPSQEEIPRQVMEHHFPTVSSLPLCRGRFFES